MFRNGSDWWGGEDSVKAFFVLSGKKKEIDKLINSKKFLGEENKEGRRKYLLKLKGVPGGAIRLDIPPEDRKIMLREILKNYQDISFPKKIKSGYPHIYPEDCPASQFQAYVWEITVSKRMEYVKPKNVPQYR